ncbi:flavin-containing amine oxidoreductase-domain containing protein [Baffinella frigidus]|nr:flavin-containing amine oxidoreductase-domain containing protein [Cryptophyta sp. CCMP2293]
MSNTCREYQDADRSMLEVIFAPVAAKFGGASSGEFGEYEDWIGRSDEDIVTATLKELEECLPAHFGPSSPQPATVRKSKVVKTPLSVYWSRPGMQVHRPKQTSPVNNFFLGGDWTSQRYLASMEGAVLSGKMAAEAIQAADEGRAVEDQSAVNTVYKGDWPQIIRNKT